MEPIAFEGELVEARGGGHAVVLDEALAASIGAKHLSRVVGTLNGRPYRSSVMKVGGRLVLGVHKANVEALGLSFGDAVAVTMALDTEPRESDVIPDDLAKALHADREVAVRWETLSAARRREHIASVLGAKKAETRERRIERIVQELLAPRPQR